MRLFARALGTGRQGLGQVSVGLRAAVWALALHLGAWASPPAAGPQAGVAVPSRCPPPAALPSADRVQQAQREARDRGFLWRLSRDGHHSYLFGTIHVGRWEWMLPGPALQQALAATDLLAVELDPGDPGQMQALQRRVRRAPDDPALPAPLEAAMARAEAAACLPKERVTGLQPVLRVVGLAITAAQRDELHAAFGQEPALTRQARQRGVPVVSLETVDLQMDALIPTDAAEQQVLLARALAQLDDGSARRVMRRLADTWAESRLDQLLDYVSWCACTDTEAERRHLQRINDGRNAAMARRIAELHVQGRRVFAAVGALHMTGPQSLPLLLEQQGFSVQRIHPRP